MADAMDKLVLFDINETLIRDMKDPSEYVSESIRNIYGTLVEVQLSKYPGMTSQEIAEAVLRENGMPQEDIDQKLVRYTEDLFYSYYNVAGHDRQILLDGAKELLDEFSKKGVLMGIATGEAEKVARFRLDKTGLSGYFKFGAFGNEAKYATGILTKALEKAQKEFEFDGSALLICSYPSFISAAREAEVKAVALENGKFSVDKLRSSGADLVVKSLKEKGKILPLI